MQVLQRNEMQREEELGLLCKDAWIPKNIAAGVHSKSEHFTSLCRQFFDTRRNFQRCS